LSVHSPAAFAGVDGINIHATNTAAAVQLRATLAELAELEPLGEDSPVDQILARRAERERRGESGAMGHAVRGEQRHG
jgi:hypothetical protein